MVNCKHIAINKWEASRHKNKMMIMLFFTAALGLTACKSPFLQLNEVSLDIEEPDTTPPATPAGFSGNAGDGLVNLSWQANSENDFDCYFVYRDNEKIKKIEDITTVSFSDYDLENGVAYSYKLTAQDKAGQIAQFSPEITVTPQRIQIISIPSNFCARGGNSNVTLNWSKNLEEIFAGYELYRDSILLADIKNRDIIEYIDTSLNNNVEYSYKLRAYDTAGQYSEYSSEIKVKPADINPPVPLEGFSIEAANGQAILRWVKNLDNDFKAYVIYQDNVLLQTIENQQATTFTSSGLINNQGYSFHMTVCDIAGNESAATPAIIATPVDFIGPDMPNNFVAQFSQNGVNLSWDKVVAEDFAQYELYRNEVLLTTIALRNQLSFIDTTAMANAQYSYKLRSVDTSGIASLFSPVIQVNTADTIPPIAPQNFSANAGEKQVTLVWAKNTNPDFASYEIFRNDLNISLISQQNLTNYTDSGLINNTTYEYKMHISDISGNYSPFSSVIAATPRDITPPQTPLNIQVIATDQGITLSWNEISNDDFERYEIYRDGNLLEEIVQKSQTTFIDTNLTNGREYNYYIKAVDTSGNVSIPSAVISAVPYAPVGVPYQYIITSPSITLNWDFSEALPQDVYRIYYATHNSNNWQFYLELQYKAIDISWNDLSNGQWDFAVSAVRDGQEFDKHTSLENTADPTTGWYIDWSY